MSYSEMVKEHSRLRKEWKAGDGDSYSMIRMIELDRAIKLMSKPISILKMDIGNYDEAIYKKYGIMICPGCDGRIPNHNCAACHGKG